MCGRILGRLCPRRTAGQASRLRLAPLGDKLRQGMPCNDAEFTESGVTGLRRLDQALGDEPAAVVIATVRQLAARLFQDDVHVRFGPFTQLGHDARRHAWLKGEHTQMDRPLLAREITAIVHRDACAAATFTRP
jgi:hypothetical protein